MSNYHRCEALNSVVPLKDDEEYCVYCSGYGGQPVPKSHTTTHNRIKCDYCDGRGKNKKEGAK